MLRRSSLVECVTCVYNASNFFYPSVCAAMFIKNPKYTFYTIKRSLTLAYYIYDHFCATKKNVQCIKFIIGIYCSLQYRCSPSYMSRVQSKMILCAFFIIFELYMQE